LTIGAGVDHILLHLLPEDGWLGRYVIDIVIGSIPGSTLTQIDEHYFAVNLLNLTRLL
jgi:hypothetical protein